MTGNTIILFLCLSCAVLAALLMLSIANRKRIMADATDYGNKIAKEVALTADNAIKAAERDCRFKISLAEKRVADKEDQIGKVLDKFTRLQFIRQPYGTEGRFNRYCVQVTFNEFAVHELFQHGNDQYAIEVMGEQLGRQVAREIRQVNFHRLFQDHEHDNRRFRIEDARI